MEKGIFIFLMKHSCQQQSLKYGACKGATIFFQPGKGKPVLLKVERQCYKDLDYKASQSTKIVDGVISVKLRLGCRDDQGRTIIAPVNLAIRMVQAVSYIVPGGHLQGRRGIISDGGSSAAQGQAWEALATGVTTRAKPILQRWENNTNKRYSFLNADHVQGTVLNLLKA